MAASAQWWRMPGPEHFVGGVLEHLREGKNVVLCVPEHLPGGLGSAIVQGQPTPWNRSWQKLRAPADSRAAPIDLLYQRFAPAARPDTLRRAASLAREPAFARQLIWLEGFSPHSWPAWRAFLEEYEHACRDQLPDERSLFCAKLSGELALQPPAPEIGLALARWDGVVSDIDTLLYTALVFPAQPLAGARRRVAISTVAALALWDPAVSDYLARQPLRAILQPGEPLARLAHARGWRADAACDPWACGREQRFGEQRRPHSAQLALCGQTDELERRVWVGQIAVLYPLLEERRRQFIHELADLLRVPFQTRDGAIIQHVYDLELGHIVYQLGERRRAGLPDPRLDTIAPQVSRLKTMRDLLAHFQALRDDQLLV